MQRRSYFASLLFVTIGILMATYGWAKLPTSAAAPMEASAKVSPTPGSKKSICDQAVTNPSVMRLSDAPGPYTSHRSSDFAGVDTFTGTDKLVATYYFYWYDASNPDAQQGHTNNRIHHEINESPAVFTWKNSGWHRKQLEDMIDAQIDIALPVYWGVPCESANPLQNFSNPGLEQMVQAYGELVQEGVHPPKIGMFYDTSSLGANTTYFDSYSAKGTDGQRKVDLTTPIGMERFYLPIRDFFSLVPPDAWAAIDGKPIVWLYNTGSVADYNGETFQYVKQRFAEDFGGLEPYIVREKSWQPDKVKLNGQWMTDNVYGWGNSLYGYERDPETDHTIASIGPGYDESAIPERKQCTGDTTTGVLIDEDHGCQRKRERMAGAWFSGQWQKVLDIRDDLNIVVIEVWNEYHEGNSIAETLEFGRQYIELNAQWAAQFKSPSPNDSVEQILIPAGEFQMGSTWDEFDAANAKICSVFADQGSMDLSTVCANQLNAEVPNHTVTLSGYYIDKLEVTNARYRACVEAGGCSSEWLSSPEDTTDPRLDDYPVVNVSYADASAFCAWEGKRLPTEAEWEKAARGTDGRIYPWGDDSRDDKQSVSERWAYGPVGSRPTEASPYGVMDMGGSVVEWIADWFDQYYYATSPADDPPGPVQDQGMGRGVRGGSQLGPDSRTTSRGPYGEKDSSLGFRCARSLGVSATAPVKAIPESASEEIHIPAGAFQMGCDSSNSAEKGCVEWKWQKYELPLHEVTLNAYAIDKYEVTNRQYQRCVEARTCTRPRDTSSPTHDSYYGSPEYDDYPVVNLKWDQANAFCQWEGKRLPTEAEWEKAARGSSNTRMYPWGNGKPDETQTNFYIYRDGLAAVGSYPNGASPYGVMDMASNAWEWISDWYGKDYYGMSPSSNPTGPAAGSLRVVRGTESRIAARSNLHPDLYLEVVGFRCARSD